MISSAQTAETRFRQASQKKEGQAQKVANQINSQNGQATFRHTIRWPTTQVRTHAIDPAVKKIVSSS